MKDHLAGPGAGTGPHSPQGFWRPQAGGIGGAIGSRVLEKLAIYQGRPGPPESQDRRRKNGEQRAVDAELIDKNASLKEPLRSRRKNGEERTQKA